MKSGTRRIWLVLVAVLSLFGTMQTPAGAAPFDHSPTGYLALGDSYAWGYGASSPATLGYAGRFAGYLGTQAAGGKFTFTNLAVPGQTSTEFLGDYAARGPLGTSQLSQAVRYLRQNEADVVTLQIGGNDLLSLLAPGQLCNGDLILTPQCQLVAQQRLQTVTTPNLAAIVGALAGAAKPGTQILVLTYPNPFSTGSGDAREQVTNVVVQYLNAIIVNSVLQLAPAAAEREVLLTTVDLFPLFAGQAATLTHIATGDIHPNDAGYAVIAVALQSAYRVRGK